jgi:hypothetical protein
MSSEIIPFSIFSGKKTEQSNAKPPGAYREGAFSGLAREGLLHAGING